MLKIIFDSCFKPIMTWYLSKERKFKYGELKFIISAGTFHPKFFFSSKILAKYIQQLDLKNKTFCEPCAGSGFISIIASKKEAEVTCFDVNPLAVKNIELNYDLNFNGQDKKFTILESDVFENVPVKTFDVIAINPPYFFNEINSTSQYAWNCGKNGEFFIKLFDKLNLYIHKNTICLMVLADNCDIERIEKIAETYNFKFKLELEKKVLWEKNYIFSICKSYSYS